MPMWEVVALLVRFEMLVRFLMVYDVLYMIGIPNLVNLSKRGLLCVLVGREIGLRVMEIVVLFSLSLFDECIIRPFF